MSDDRPPPGTSWNRLYAAVLLFLLVQIVLYAFFTSVYS